MGPRCLCDSEPWMPILVSDRSTTSSSPRKRAGICFQMMVCRDLTRSIPQSTKALATKLCLLRRTRSCCSKPLPMPRTKGRSESQAFGQNSPGRSVARAPVRPSSLPPSSRATTVRSSRAASAGRRRGVACLRTLRKVLNDRSHAQGIWASYVLSSDEREKVGPERPAVIGRHHNFIHTHIPKGGSQA